MVRASPANCRDVTEHRVHCRLRGSCRRSASPATAHDPDRQLVGDDRRLVPGAASRASRTAASMRADDFGVGLAPDGRNGLLRWGQCSACAAVSPTPNLLPSKWLAASMRRGSMSISRSKAAAIGAAVSRARSNGEHERADVVPGEALRDPLGHFDAELGQVVPGQPPVEHTLRVVHLAVPHDVDHRHDGTEPRGLGSGTAAARRAASGSASSTRAEPPPRRAPRRGTRPRTRTRAGRRRGRASRGRRRRKRSVRCRLGVVVVTDRRIGEEDGEHGPGELHPVLDAFRGQRLGGSGR